MTGAFSIGIIGGSGLYHMEALQERQEHFIETPYGSPSDHLVSGKIHGVPVVFLARHGRGHRLMPSEIPFLANIWALKSLGVSYLISVSAVGSLQEQYAPLDAVLPNQFIDMTRTRPRTFFGQGIVVHVGMAQPVCLALQQVLADAAQATGFGRGRVHQGGTYVCIEGPQFSTLAESQWYRSMGADIIGMTNMPEARLALEAEMAYATIGLVTDYDCWHPTHGSVTAEMAIANVMENAANAQRLVIETVRRLGLYPPVSAAHQALKSAVITPFEHVPQATRDRLQPLLAKYQPIE